MYETVYARRLASFRHVLSTVSLCAFKALTAFFVENADQVHDRIRAIDSRGNRLRIADIRLNDIDPTRSASQTNIAGKMRAPNRNTNPIACFDKRSSRVSADKARSAEEGHKFTSHLRGLLLSRMICTEFITNANSIAHLTAKHALDKRSEFALATPLLISYENWRPLCIIHLRKNGSVNRNWRVFCLQILENL
jgi:hypothetical protein